MIEITFDDIARVNNAIKTTDIKGKEYAEVNQRIKAFRMLYPKGTIMTELLSNENGICVFKATVIDEADKILATGTAYEKEGNSFINKTSYIENCETSAVGRALGMAGFGIDTSVASYEEVANAMEQQDMNSAEKIIDKTKEESLLKSISNNSISEQTVADVLGKFGYESTKQIKLKDYMPIIQEFQKLIGVK